MRSRDEYYQRFEIGQKGTQWTLPTLGADTCLVAAEPQTAWGAAVITWYRSLDGVTPYGLEVAVTSTAAGMSATIDCSGFSHLLGRVTTAGTASTYANLSAQFNTFER